MINPNKDTSDDVLRRLKEGSYERMRVELKESVEAKLKDYDMTWDDLGRLLGMKERKKVTVMGFTRADRIKHRIIQGRLTLNDLNTLAHVFSCEPYLLFRPRSPWTKT